MKRLFVCLLISLLLVSCKGAVERAQQNFRIGRVESVERQGLRGAKVSLQVCNSTGHKVVFKEIGFTVYSAGTRMADISLRARVEVPRGTNGSIVSLWRTDFADPLAGDVLLRKLRQNDLGQTVVSYIVKARAGMIPIEIRQGMMPMSDFLNNFGLSLDEITACLENV